MCPREPVCYDKYGTVHGKGHNSVWPIVTVRGPRPTNVYLQSFFFFKKS